MAAWLWTSSPPMSMPPEPDRHAGRFQSMAIAGVALVVLLAFAVFFWSILVAPLAILIAFYLAFAAWGGRAT